MRVGTLAALGAGVLVVVASCRSATPPPPAPAPPPARSSLGGRWVPLRAPESISFLELPAAVLVTPGTSGLVNPPYPGQIVSLHVRAGERVRRGQPVADVMMPTVVAAAGEQAAARTKVDAYLDRLRQLEALKAEGLARAVDLAEVQTSLAEARADEKRAGAILRSAGIDPQRRRRLADHGSVVSLRSPIDGLVIEVSAALGETRDSAGAPIVRIAGTGPARIEARAAQRLPEDAKFEFVTAAGERIPVRLIAEAPVVDPRDGTAASWFAPAPVRELPGGLSGKLRIVLPSRPGLTVAPRSSVGGGVDAAFVRLRRDGGVETVPVTVLLSSGADALIQSSLSAGAEIAERASEPGR